MLKVPLVERSHRNRADLNPFDTYALAETGIQLQIAFTATQLIITRLDRERREFVVDVAAIIDAALRAIDAVQKQEARK